MSPGLVSGISTGDMPVFRASDISRGRGAAKFWVPTKSRKIHKNVQNTMKFAKGLIK